MKLVVLMSLVRGIDAEPRKRRIVRSMIELCNDLGASIIAEGVETTAERDTLVALGCDLLQGYLYAKPERGFVKPEWDTEPGIRRPSWPPRCEDQLDAPR